MLVFFSPTGVRALKENLPDFVQGDIKIAAFGPATAKEVKDQGLRLDLEAPSGTASFYDRGITCLLRRAKEIKKQEIDLLKYASLNTKKVYS